MRCAPLLPSFPRTCDARDELPPELDLVPDLLLVVVQRVVQVGDGLWVELVEQAHALQQRQETPAHLGELQEPGTVRRCGKGKHEQTGLKEYETNSKP